MIKGKIIKKISKFYYVFTPEHKIYECEAKGIFRYNNIKPLVGDDVVIEHLQDNIALITEILPRKNVLYRPEIANVDCVAIVISLKSPNFSSYLLNKYLAMIEYNNYFPIIFFTKIDLLSIDNDIWTKIKWYQLQYDVFLINNKIHNHQINLAIKKMLAHKITVFIGQTGSGKSSTLNTLLEIELIKTQEISQALNRGKHTTTNSQLYEVGEGLIADTPGFSAFNLSKFNKSDLAIAYHLFANQLGKCKFRGCLHLNEPECVIKKSVVNGEIPEFFYQDYVKISQELES